MLAKGSHRCFYCDRQFIWSVVIKDDYVETVDNRADVERGIPTFTGKNKIEVEVNCPSCRNVNRFKWSLK